MQTYEAAAQFSHNEFSQLEYPAEFSTSAKDTYVYANRDLNNLNSVDGSGSTTANSSNPSYFTGVSTPSHLCPTTYLRASKHRGHVKANTWQLGQGRSRDSLDTIDTDSPLHPESFDYDQENQHQTMTYFSQNGALPSKHGFIHFSNSQPQDVYGEPFSMRAYSDNPHFRASESGDKSVLKLPELTAEALDNENFRPLKRQISVRTFEDRDSINHPSILQPPSLIRKMPSMASFGPPSDIYPDTPRTSWEYPSFLNEPVHLKFGYLVFGSNTSGLSPTASSRNHKSPMANYDYAEPLSIDPNSFEISGSDYAVPGLENSNSLLTFEPQTSRFPKESAAGNQQFPNGSWANERYQGQDNDWGLGEETRAGAGGNPLPNDNHNHHHTSSFYPPLQPLREETEGDWGRNGKMLSSQGKKKGNDSNNNVPGQGNKKNEKSSSPNKTNKQITSQPMAMDQFAESTPNKESNRTKKKTAKAAKNGNKNLATFIIGIPGDDDFNVKKKIFGPGGKKHEMHYFSLSWCQDPSSWRRKWFLGMGHGCGISRAITTQCVSC